MAYKVLIVDDSTFFQTRLKEIINSHPDLTVIGIAGNGRQAIEMAQALQPDVISMDYEMPYLDGVSAVRAIMAERPVPIVMFSSLTYEGARITLDALEAGAVDFLPKNFAEVTRGSEQLKRKLQESLLFYAKEARAHRPQARRQDGAGPGSARAIPTPERSSARPRPTNTHSEPKAGQSKDLSKDLKGHVDLVVIGASTGGPVAVTEVLRQLPASFSVPIVVIQHMPPNFTRVFAERLDRQCAIGVREAKNGEILEPGMVWVAPGGFQLIFDRNRRERIKVMEGDNRMSYKPSVDITFASAAGVFGGRVLAVVLTGMGTDGCEGARLLKERGAAIWTQNQDSCVVYGMPRAIASAGLTDEILSPVDVGARMVKEF